jgi:hypothetical protein
MDKLNTQYNKAVAGGASGGTMGFAAGYAIIQVLAQNMGWTIDDWQLIAIATAIAAITGAIHGGIVWRVPNRVVDPEMHTMDALDTQQLGTQEMDTRGK